MNENQAAYGVAEQYKTSTNLEARITLHERFSTNPYGLNRWVFDHFELPGQARILELGCGVGRLWLENLDRIPADWDVTLSDFSEGMLQQTQQNLAQSGGRFRFQVIEVTDIPLEAEQFDAVIANHMLYYVEDKPRALAQIHRVLRPGGRLYTTTNGRRHMHELVDLIAQFDVAIPFLSRTIESYTLETGALLVAEWFGDVEVRRYPDSLVVTDEDALLGYILSSSAVFNLPIERREALTKFVRERFAAASRVFTITKEPGIICGKRTKNH